MVVEAHARELADYFHVIGKRMARIDSDPDVCELIKGQEGHVLMAVGSKEKMMMREISDAINLSLSSATALVDQLEEKKWVRRDRSEEDRRVVWVSLTAAGRKLFDQFDKMRLKLTGDVLGTLDQKEQEHLLVLFRKIAAKLDHV